MTESCALELSHIAKSFDAVPALAGVSLEVRPGEIHVLLGENGAGKTTLFKILAGIYPAGAYTGEIRVAGRAITNRNPQDAIQNGIGSVARRSGIFSRMNVTENITMGQWPRHGGFLLRRDLMERDAREILARLELKLELSQPAGRLTPGQQRLVMIARALSAEPKVIVLDEPASTLKTAGEQTQLIRAVRLLAERGIGLLYLARRPADAVLVADRVTVLRDGELNGSWPRAELDELALTQAMMSRRIGDGDYVDYDAAEEPAGLLGTLRSWFLRNT